MKCLPSPVCGQFDLLWSHYIKSNITLGSLHTRAKSRDHEIVRAQKKVSKGHPNTPPKSCSVVTNPRVWCEVICDWALNHMLFQ